jgi:hypothetical protein
MVSRFVVTDRQLPIKGPGAMLLDSYYCIVFFRRFFRAGPSSVAIGDSGGRSLLLVPAFGTGYWLQ